MRAGARTGEKTGAVGRTRCHGGGHDGGLEGLQLGASDLICAAHLLASSVPVPIWARCLVVEKQVRCTLTAYICTPYSTWSCCVDVRRPSIEGAQVPWLGG